MYCNKCGDQMNEGQMFCGRCGTGMGMTGWYTPAAPQQMITIREKSTGIAAVLSIVWAGLGHVYVGRIGRGLALMATYFLAVFIGFFSFVIGGLFGGLVGAVGGVVFVGMLYLIMIIWSVFDAYKLANEYNDTIRNGGKRPW